MVGEHRPLMYDIWVEVEPGIWEQYTRQPFKTKVAANEWRQRYIPEASVEVRPIAKAKGYA